jgi:hypothetical protein
MHSSLKVLNLVSFCYEISLVITVLYIICFCFYKACIGNIFCVEYSIHTVVLPEVLKIQLMLKPKAEVIVFKELYCILVFYDQAWIGLLFKWTLQ